MSYEQKGSDSFGLGVFSCSFLPNEKSIGIFLSGLYIFRAPSGPPAPRGGGKGGHFFQTNADVAFFVFYLFVKKGGRRKAEEGGTREAFLQTVVMLE